MKNYQKSKVVFTLFNVINQDSKGLEISEGSIVFFGLGFRKDFDRYTCLPRPLGGVGFYNLIGVRDSKQYPKLQTISRDDIPNDLSGTPRIKEYLIYPQFENSLITNLTSLSVEGKVLQNAFFYGKRVVFQRLGYQIEVACNSIPDDERFTLALEWGKDSIGIWISWVDQNNAIQIFENKMQLDMGIDLSSIEHIKLQFLRLDRHYNSALAMKDQISFLDLAHCLRIWDDLKTTVDTLLRQLDHHVEFENTVPSKKLRRTLKGSSFISIPLSTEVESPRVRVKGLMMIKGVLNEEQRKRLFEIGPPSAQKTKLSFSEWLGAEIFENRTVTGERLGISRGMLIRRVANILGASHPQRIAEEKEEENRFDPYVRELHQYVVADGFPLTYYQLIEIAGEIIRNFRTIWGKDSPSTSVL